MKVHNLISKFPKVVFLISIAFFLSSCCKDIPEEDRNFLEGYLGWIDVVDWPQQTFYFRSADNDSLELLIFDRRTEDVDYDCANHSGVGCPPISHSEFYEIRDNKYYTDNNITFNYVQCQGAQASFTFCNSVLKFDLKKNRQLLPNFKFRNRTLLDVSLHQLKKRSGPNKIYLERIYWSYSEGPLAFLTSDGKFWGCEGMRFAHDEKLI